LVEKESYSDDDSDLIRRCKRGDESAFEEIVRKYQQAVFKLVYHNIGYRGDVEDVVQTIFTKVYFSLSKFDDNRPFFPWLYRIATNQSYDELRRLRRQKVRTFTELSLEDTDRIEALVNQNEISPSSPQDSKEIHALLLKLLDKLPHRQRMAIVLRDIEDVSYERMAEILNCTEQAARLKVFRARSRLKRLLERSLRRKKLASRKA
jgi:RNA polymerase sigma-70 factor, ECF subfamily